VKSLKFRKKNAEKSIANRLKRVKGQIEAVERMYNEKRDCLEIVQQLTAATSALKKITESVLTDEVCSSKLGDKKWREKLSQLFKVK